MPSSPDIGLLITENQQRVYSYIYSLTGDRSASWDILQETNLVLWKKRDDFATGTRFTAWALSVARFQVMAFLRDGKRERLSFLTPELMEEFGEDPEIENEAWFERMSALQHCRKQLTQRSQTLLSMFYEQGLSLVEIGHRLEMTINSIKQGLFRVRRNLQDCIETQVPSRIK